MTNFRLFLGVLTAACFSMPMFGAIEFSHTGMKDETVSAEYNWVENNCISKHIDLQVTKTKVNDDGSVTNQSDAILNYSIYNFCDTQHRTQAFYHGESAAISYAVDPLLRSASVQAPAFPVLEMLVDGNGNVTQGRSFTVAINMTWSSNDPVDRIPNVTVTNYPGYYSISAFFGFYRMANATGVISDGTQNWIPAAPDNTFCRIYRLISGVVTIIKK